MEFGHILRPSVTTCIDCITALTKLKHLEFWVYQVQVKYTNLQETGEFDVLILLNGFQMQTAYPPQSLSLIHI